MGDHDATQELDEEALREFTRALLDDVTALERMIERGTIERDRRRIGAEQELFLVDGALRPAPVVTDVLDAARDPRLTTEMARFNLEANLSPRLYGGRCLRELETELDDVLRVARRAAAEVGAQVVLAGILPTLRQGDLGLDNMSPVARYHGLAQAMARLRGGDFYVRIRGLDDLEVAHDNVMLESCNTSFQIHFQVGAQEFARLYNLAQVVTAPVLAAAVNAPLLFGRRLWHETRVALFESSVDERSAVRQRRAQPPRVQFGHGWVRDSVLEIFREDIARFRIVLARELDEPSTRLLDRGEVPTLRALGLHNGTVYRWNRACYGVTDGRPHLRIEQRALPAGPTVRDEVANAAFFYGLMGALAEEHAAIEEVMSFDDARQSFFAAARHGLRGTLTWIGGRTAPAAQLILNELLPAARAGLRHAGIDAADADRYLDVIEERVRRQRTGAEWMLQAAARLETTPELRDRALVQAMIDHQTRGEPVHTWPLPDATRVSEVPHGFDTAAQIMSTDLFTVQPDDLVDLAASVMKWQHVHCVPVEDEEGRPVGLLSHRGLLKVITQGGGHAVREFMDPAPELVSPDAPTLEVVERLLRSKHSCVLVVDGGKLVGIVTDHDVMKVAARLLRGRPGAAAGWRPPSPGGEAA